jgi:hypothetical protein
VISYNAFPPGRVVLGYNSSVLLEGNALIVSGVYMANVVGENFTNSSITSLISNFTSPPIDPSHSFNLSLNASTVAQHGTKILGNNVTLNYKVSAEGSCNLNLSITPAWNSSVSVSNTVAPCNVTATANQIAKLAINGTYTAPNTIYYPQYGVNIIIPATKYNIDMPFVPLGQNLSIPEANIFVGSIGVNDFINNRTLQDSLMSSLAAQNCSEGGLINIWDYRVKRNTTMCTNFTDTNISEAFALSVQTNLLLNRSLQGIGQSYGDAVVFANYGSTSWHTNYTDLKVSSSNQISADEETIRTQNTTITSQNQTISNGNIELVAVTVVIIVLFTGMFVLFNRFRRVNEDAERIAAHQNQGQR